VSAGARESYEMFGRLLLLLSLLLGVILNARAMPTGIACEPCNQSVILYQQAAFGVIVAGAEPVSFQWRKDGVPILGATNDQLIIPQPLFSDMGLYSVVISNAQGTVTSADAALTVRSPVEGDIDYSFAWRGQINGPIYSTAIQSDGKILIAGGFRTVHGALRMGIARLNSDGSTDYTFRNEISLQAGSGQGLIYTVALQSDSKIIIAGDFSNINGINRAAIARLNRDGTLDLSFISPFPSGELGRVLSVVQLSDGRLLIGGVFRINEAYPPIYSGIARLFSDGRPDPSFPSHVRGWVYAMAFQNDGKILIGGSFDQVNTVSNRYNLARLYPDGSLDQAFFTNAWPLGTVRSIAIQNDNQVLIAGDFRDLYGVGKGGIARLNATDGTLDTNFLNGLPGASKQFEGFIVHSVALQDDGKVLIGGNFDTVNGVARNCIARLHPNGVLDNNFFDVSVSNLKHGAFSIRSLVLQTDGRILVGGDFRTVNGVSRRAVARLHGDGSLDATFHNSSSGPDNRVESMALQNDGKLVLGGGFELVDGRPCSGVARLSTNGTVDCGFLEGLSGTDPWWGVDALALQADGKILIGGRQFSTIDGVSPGRIARLHPDGTLDESFQNALAESIGTYDVFVRSLAVQSDQKVLMGGELTVLNPLTRHGFARLNSDGTLDTTFPELYSSIFSIVVQENGRLVLAAPLEGRVSRYYPDGTLDFSSQFPNASSIAAQPDGKVLVGSCCSFGRLNANGSRDTNFLEGVWGPNNTVSAIAVQRDGRILVGGNLSRVNNITRNRIARLNADGSLDNSFLNGLSGGNGPVDSVLVQNDGKILIGGSFNQFNGAPGAYLARLWAADTSPVIKSITRTNNQVNLVWSAVSNRTYRVQFAISLAFSNWYNLPGDVLATSATATKTDASLGTLPRRYYRVLLLP
jgi:uncharacterized delta-60 repeat protein